jgi:hypothetical protein
MAKNICLHNGTVVTGYTVLEECAVLVGDGKIVEVFNERRFKQKTLPSSTEVYDVAGLTSPRDSSMSTYTVSAVSGPTMDGRIRSSPCRKTWPLMGSQVFVQRFTPSRRMR